MVKVLPSAGEGERNLAQPHVVNAKSSKDQVMPGDVSLAEVSKDKVMVSKTCNSGH